MDRFIDTVMVSSDRVDERARLITRLCDLLAPLVGDLGPDTAALVRGALLSAIRAGHDQPFDVVAEVLDRLSDAVGTAPTWRQGDLTPGGALAVGICDGRGVTDFALGAAIGIDRDEVATARDAARLSLGLPPAPPACTGCHAGPGADRDCVPCVVVRADAATARPRLASHVDVPAGPVMDRVTERARRWEAAVRRGRRQVAPEGPSPWTGVVDLAV